MRKFKSLIILCSLVLMNGHSLFAEVIPYEFPAELPVVQTVTVSVDGISISVLETKLGSILSFGMDSPVEIVITLKKRARSVAVRPLSAGIKAEIKGKQCKLRLSKPMNLSVEFDSDIDNPFFIFANPPEQRPDKNDPLVHYFEAGKTHVVGEIRIESGETLYLEGGAVVHGTVRSVDQSDVSLRGPGIFDCRPRTQKTNMLFFRKCDGVSIEDVILIGTLGWSIHLSGSENIDMQNVRVISWRANSDGLDIEYCRKVKVDNCFWRTSDDCIAVKALFPPDFDGMSESDMTNPEKINTFTGAKIPGDVIGDITITRSVLWNDLPGNAFEVGFELRIDHIRDINFIDNDIIHVRRGAAFSIHNCDRAQIENVLVENVRVEDTDELFDLYLGLAVYSEDCPEPYRRNNPARRSTPRSMQDAQAHDNSGQWIIPKRHKRDLYEENRGKLSNITFRNITVLTEPRSQSILSGYNEHHNIENVLFENVVIEDRLIDSVEEMNLILRHIENIRFY